VVSFLRLEGCLVAVPVPVPVPVPVVEVWMELVMDWNGRERIVL
jgi:hypothetical protein